jgi:(4S)-4-hydroxy-5-phosphonooxypentane-2,3-dione isomerase
MKGNAMPVFHTAHLRVRPDAIDAFKARIARHAATSLREEAGCSRFDVHQEREDPTLFLLVECYDDERAFDLHRASPHYLGFRQDVEDWVVERTWWYWERVA